MEIFKSMLVLLTLATLLLQVSRKFKIPYPTMLALAGLLVAALPWAPSIAIDPHLMLVLFIAPALLDAAFDLPPRSIASNWRPLIALAAVAVILSTAAVAWFGIATGMPWAVAITLGAIVAPPDAAAASAMMSRFDLPRRTVIVLKGESLLNDAVALLIFAAASRAAMGGGFSSTMVPMLSLAIPGGVLLGIAGAFVYMKIAKHLAGSLGGTLFEFVAVFGMWLIADLLHSSAILCVVAFGMTIARYVPERQSPRVRVHSYSVWGTVVFLLNVLAFLLIGLQARAIFQRLNPGDLSHYLKFSATVFAILLVVRIGWVLLYNQAVRVLKIGQYPKLKQQLVVSWCGMRGLVTMAAALALPHDFPSRDLIVLTALLVVIGSLVIQGLTLGPLISLLNFGRDDSFNDELAKSRTKLLRRGLAVLDGDDRLTAQRITELYQAELAESENGGHPRGNSESDRLLQKSIIGKRTELMELRRRGEIEEDVFHALEAELDWEELSVLPIDRLELMEG